MAWKFSGKRNTVLSFLALQAHLLTYSANIAQNIPGGCILPWPATTEYYSSKNLPHSVITMSKDFMIGPPRPEKSGVSKYSWTFGHPVVKNVIITPLPMGSCVFLAPRQFWCCPLALWPLCSIKTHLGPEIPMISWASGVIMSHLVFLSGYHMLSIKNASTTNGHSHILANERLCSLRRGTNPYMYTHIVVGGNSV